MYADENTIIWFTCNYFTATRLLYYWTSQNNNELIFNIYSNTTLLMNASANDCFVKCYLLKNKDSLHFNSTGNHVFG